MDFTNIESMSYEQLEELYEETSIACGCYCGSYEVPVDIEYGYNCTSQSCINKCASFCGVSSSRCSCSHNGWRGDWRDIIFPGCP